MYGNDHQAPILQQSRHPFEWATKQHKICLIFEVTPD